MRRFKPRLRPLSEAEAYARCHGRRESEVRIVHLEPRRPRYELRVTGEDLRQSFERRLDSRESSWRRTYNRSIFLTNAAISKRYDVCLAAADSLARSSG